MMFRSISLFVRKNVFLQLNRTFTTTPAMCYERSISNQTSIATHLLFTPLTLCRNFSRIDFNRALKEFEEQLSEEIAYENELKQELPTYPKFDISVTGTTAKLVRKIGKNVITITVNSNDKEEPEFEGQGDDDDEDDEENGARKDIENSEDDDNMPAEEQEFMYLPLVNINIKKSTGHQLELACSFNTKGTNLKSILSEGLHVTSANVSGPGENLKHSYNLDTSSWDGNLYDSLVIYLQSFGLDQNFLAYLIKFYQIFEHRSYLDLCLTKLEDFYKN